MRHGRLEQVGTPEEIYDAPESAFVASFIGGANLIPVRVERADDRRATLVLPGGRQGNVAIEGQRFGAGDAALLMLRPERVELAAKEPKPDRVGLPVTCTDLVFQGAVLRCALRDAAGGEQVASVDAARRDPALRPGAALWLCWEPDAARLLPSSSESSRAPGVS
jgi:ABC-type Fe3+/spermidine/putrescine transport system ATPase subunit